MQKFIKGNACEDDTMSQLTVSFKNGLEDGEYVILYKVSWEETHKYRKLVFSAYSDEPL